MRRDGTGISAKEQLVVELSGKLIPVADICKVSGMQPSSVHSIRTRFKSDIDALVAKTRSQLVETMSDDLKEAAGTIARKYSKRAKEMAESGELSDRVALQILRMGVTQFIDKPATKTENTHHIHLTLEQQTRFQQGTKEIEGDWKQGAIEAPKE